MIIDVAIILIVLFFVFLGFKNGFICTILNTFGWALAIAAAYFLRKPFQTLLEKHTAVYDHLYKKTSDLMADLLAKFDAAPETASAALDNAATGVQSPDATKNIPGLLKNALDNAPERIAEKAAEQTADMLFAIIAFLTLLFAAKLLLSIISILLSKKYRQRGIVGGIDGLAGAAIGLAQAALLVLTLLALLLPLSYLISADAYSWVVHSMDRSIFSQYLYEHNPLLSFVQEYVPSDLLPAEWFA